jgi:hypothetical protein
MGRFAAMEPVESSIPGPAAKTWDPELSFTPKMLYYRKGPRLISAGQFNVLNTRTHIAIACPVT